MNKISSLQGFFRALNKQDAAFVAAMEDALSVYERPYTAAKPLICMDEKPYQLLGEAREPVPADERHCKREDGEYMQMGTCGIFMSG